MLKENQKIKITWTQTAQNYYGKLGYTLNKGDFIFVDPEILPKGSHRRVKVICDCCGKELGMEYRQYVDKIQKFGGKYYCSKCGSGAPETKQKRIDTCLQKYGVANPMNCPEIASKCAAALNKNEGVSTSTQQKEIFNMLSTKYQAVVLNYLEGSFSLDCMCTINNQKIDVEYDGWYWHMDQQKDIKRDKILQTKGYKILRIRSGKLLPSSEELFNALNDLVESNYNFKELVLSDYKKEEITK